MQHLQIICLALFLPFTPFAAASSTPTAIVPDNVILCQPDSGCFSKSLFGRSYQVLSTPRFTVMASVSREGDYLRADVSLLNTSGLPLNLAPDDFRVEVVTPKPMVLNYILPADLKGIPASPAIPPPPRDNSKVSATSPLRVLAVSSTEAPSVEEIYVAVKRRQVVQAAHDYAEAQQHLEASEVAPDETVRGRVYFKRDKHAEAINLVLPVAGLVFEFPYQMKR